MKGKTPIGFGGYVALGVILLNFTNLYTFFAGLTGISFRLMGMGFILIMLSYCIFNRRILEQVLKVPVISLFLIAFFLIPLISMVYTPIKELRYLGYIINSGLLFLISAIWTYKHGWYAYSRLIFFSWIVCICGVLLSYISPGVFREVAALQEELKGRDSLWVDTRIAQADQMRAFGFYMQSNRAAHAIIMHLLVLCPFLFHRRPYWRLLVLLISFGCILLTGSRTGFVVVTGFSSLLFYYELRYGVFVKSRLSSGISAVPKYVVLVLSSIIGLLLIGMVAKDGAEKAIAGDAVSRIVDTLFSSDYAISEDVSVRSRILAQGAFLDGILERPIQGWGHAADEVHKFSGKLPLSSHNMYLDVAYQYGAPTAFVMYGLIIYCGFSIQSARALQFFRVNAAMIVAVVLCVYSFASNTCFDQRMFPSMFGFLMVVLYFPREVSKGFGPSGT